MRRRGSGTFVSLRRYRNYRLFFGGQLASLVGTWMQETALPWLMLSLTHSPFDVGLLALCRYAPFTLFAIVAGAFADRFDSRRYLCFTQSSSMAIALTLAALSATGTARPWHLFVLAALGGSILVFDSPARFRLVTRLVGLEDAPNAITLSSGLTNAARVVGPAVAGIVIAVAGLTACFLANAASFLAVLTALILMREGELQPVVPGPAVPVVSAVGEALTFVRHGRADIKAILLLVLLMSATALNFRVLLPVLASDTLSSGASVFGLLIGAYGLGAVVGTLVAAGAGASRWQRIVTGMLGFSAGVIVLAPLRSVAAAMVVLVFVGICFSLWAGQSQSLLMIAAPSALRGRMAALYLFAMLGLAPVGAVAAGWIAGISGTTFALALLGTIGLAGSVVGAIVLRIRSSRADAYSP